MGTEEFWVPAVLAAVSAAGQGVNQMQANKRASNAETQSIADQDTLREQANSQVKNLTQQISQNSPAQQAQQATSNFVNTLRKNEAGSEQSNATGTGDTNFGAPVSALPSVNGASSRYKTGAANAQQQTQQYGNTNASEMGAVDGAVLQRQNEGLAMQTLGTNLNGLAQQSYMKNFVDQLRAQTAGQANPWASLFSGMLSNGANAYSKNPTMFNSTSDESVGDGFGAGN